MDPLDFIQVRGQQGRAQDLVIQHFQMFKKNFGRRYAL